MLSETGARDPNEWPKDPESQGWFYESWGDALAPSRDAEPKYWAAHSNFSIFASGSTSGGEGTARMIDVNRVLRKIDAVKG